MKKLTFVSVWVFALGCAGNTHAADNAVPLLAAPTWSGFYAGATAGGAWGSLDPQTTPINNTDFGSAANVAAVNATGMQSITPSSFTGGLEAGYNWQWGGLVGGLEVDLGSFRLAGTAINGGIYPTSPPKTFAVTTSINSNGLFTARPRLGYATTGCSTSPVVSL
jgi:outer membrane immunogenic protein